MSCGLAFAAVLAFADPVAATPTVAPVSIAAEPLFLDIVARADALKGEAEGWRRSGYGERTDFFSGEGFSAFRTRAAELATLDMQGHATLRARGVDGDLKCILRGISEDLPLRISALETAADAAERTLALDELIHLLDDNVAVIIAPAAKP